MKFFDFGLLKSARIKPPTVETIPDFCPEFAVAHLITSRHVPKDTLYMTTGNCIRGEDGLWRNKAGEVVGEPRHVFGNMGFNGAAKAVNIEKETDSGRAERENSG